MRRTAARTNGGSRHVALVRLRTAVLRRRQRRPVGRTECLFSRPPFVLAVRPLTCPPGLPRCAHSRPGPEDHMSGIGLTPRSAPRSARTPRPLPAYLAEGVLTPDSINGGGGSGNMFSSGGRGSSGAGNMFSAVSGGLGGFLSSLARPGYGGATKSPRGAGEVGAALCVARPSPAARSAGLPLRPDAPARRLSCPPRMLPSLASLASAASEAFLLLCGRWPPTRGRRASYSSSPCPALLPGPRPLRLGSYCSGGHRAGRGW